MRSLPLVALLALLAAASPTLGQSYGYFQDLPDSANLGMPVTKNDRITADYASAYLLYDAAGQKGGIVWAPNQTRGSYTSDRTAGLLDLAWTSLVPVPRDLYLNATREIDVTLYRASPSCYNEPIQYTVDLLLDGRRIAGWIPGMKVLWKQDIGAPLGSPVRPDDPVGYCARYFRLRAETDHIPAGSKIDLRVHQEIDYNAVNAQPSRFGMFGRSQSVIRFPTLPVEDAIYRHRVFDGQDVLDLYTGPAGGNAASDGSAAAAAGALLAVLLPRDGRTRRATVALAVLLLAGMAGCLGDRGGPDALPPVPPAPTGGTIETHVVPLEQIDQTAGWLAGRVFDERHLPVAGAFVLLEGTENASYTDKYAGFLFRDLRPRDYLLRAEAPGFRPFVGQVTVAPGGITKVEVKLEPLQGRSDDLRNHTHDLWLGRDTIQFPSVNVRMKNYHRENTSTWTNLNEQAPDRKACLWRNSGSTIPPRVCGEEFFLKGAPGAKEHPMILPGTSLLEFRVEWNGGDDAVRSVGMFLDHRADETRVVLPPRASGDPFVVPVTWEMADHGHQSFSLWRFGLYLLPAAQAPSNVPADGFRVNAQIHRGPLPLDPPHPDLWGRNETLLIRDHRTTQTTCRPPQDDGVLLYTGATCEFPAYELRLIPAGTLWLETFLNHTYSVVNTPATVPTRPRDLDLRYWTAGDPHWSSNGRVAPTQGTPKAGPNNAAGGYFLERIIICLNRPEHAPDPDPTYETKTSWRFRVDDGHPEPYEPSPVTWTFRLGLVAHRTVPPSACPA